MDVKRVIQVGSSLKNVGFDLADNLSFMKNLHKIVVNEIDPVTLKKLEEAGVLDLSVEFFEKLFTVNGKYEAENCMFKGVDIDTPEGQGVMERVFEFRKSFPKACKAMENIEKELALPKLKPRF